MNPYYSDGRATLYQGEALAVLGSLPTGSHDDGHHHHHGRADRDGPHDDDGRDDHHARDHRHEHDQRDHHHRDADGHAADADPAHGYRGRGAVNRYECAECGVTASDIALEGVDPDYWFERDDDGAMVCGGCAAMRVANQRFVDGDW